jgi:hypothetical protein
MQNQQGRDKEGGRRVSRLNPSLAWRRPPAAFNYCPPSSVFSINDLIIMPGHFF